MLKFLKQSRGELQKVQWPKREEVMDSTIVVLVVIGIISMFLFFVDTIFEEIFNWVIQ